MSITLGDAVVYLTANNEGLNQALSGAKQKVTGWAGGLGGTVATLAGGAVLAGATAAAGAVVGIGTAAANLSGQVAQAQRDLRTELGASAEEAERLGGVAKKVFAGDFAGTIGEAASAVGEARKQLGDLGDKELQTAAERAIALKDAFGPEYKESMNAAAVLMDEFGLSEQQAFDFLAKGYQEGLDSSGDFLDSIREYGGLFGQSKATAGEFFSLMQTGLQGGVLGTDKAADMFKEFSIRIVDGSQTTRDGLDSIGLGWRNIEAGLADGSISVTDAFSMISGELAKIEDPIRRNQLGVALFGTQFEDLGDKAALGLDLTKTKLDDMAGAGESLNEQYNNWTSLFSSLWRQSLVALSPVSDKLLGLANNVMPAVREKFAAFLPTIEGLSEKLGILVSFVADLFSGQTMDVSTYVDFIKLFGPDFTETLLGVVTYIRDSLLPALNEWGTWLLNEGLPALSAFGGGILRQVLPGLAKLFEWGLAIGSVVWPILVNGISWAAENMSSFLPVMLAVGAGILALSSPVTAIAGLILLLGSAWANNWGGIQEKTQQVMATLQPYFDVLKQILTDFYADILPALQQVWQTMTDQWTNQLQPALANLWAAFSDLFAALGFGTGDTDLLAVALAILKTGLDGFVILLDLLNPLIEGLATFLAFAAEQITTAAGNIGDLITGLEGIYNWILKLITKIGEFGEGLASVGDYVPDWLVPGSPTPFEMGLRGISKALKAVSDVDVNLGAGEQGLATKAINQTSTDNRRIDQSKRQEFNLYVNSSQPVETITQEYAFLKAMG